jgi:DNA-binding GntR family transcriptional regulator
MTALEKGELESIYAELQTLTTAEKTVEYLELNNELHARICAGVHNATISAMTRELRDRLAPFRQQQAGTIEHRLNR